MIRPARITHRVTGASGVNLSVPEWGDPAGPPILLIHGWSQAHQAWAKQLGGALDRFRLVAPDLRGHGGSDKPEGDGHYDNGQPWADDIAAIIGALGLDRPVLVGWSMGGWVTQDYLRHHGDAAIAGAVIVGSSLTTGTEMPDAAQALRGNDSAVSAKGMYGTDTTANIAATIAFVGTCFHRPPTAAEAAFITAYNMLCPPGVRSASRRRSEDYRPVTSACRKPLAFCWGTHDRLAVPPLRDEARAALPEAAMIEFEDSGHSPFFEEADRFNAMLTDFAARTMGMAA